MEREDRHAFIKAQTRTRESRDILSNVIHKDILGTATLMKITSSGLKKVADQSVVTRKPTTSRTILTELGLDRAALTIQVTIAASSETSIVIDWDMMPSAA
jgi:hypothetical protein